MNNIFNRITEIEDSWFSEILGSPNGSPVSVRVMNDVVAPFHTHETADEMFVVLSGIVHIDTPEGSTTLTAGQAYTVLSGVEHRARVKGRAELIVIGGQNA